MKNKCSLAVLILGISSAALIQSARAETNTYIGASSGSWSTSGTLWSTGAVPGITSDVVMSIDGFSWATGVPAINSLTVAAATTGASYPVMATDNLTVTNSVVLASTSTGISMIQWNNTGTLAAQGFEMGGTTTTILRVSGAGTLNLNGGAGSITNTGTGSATLQFWSTGFTLNATSVNVDQIEIGRSANTLTASQTINSGQSYAVSSTVQVGTGSTGGTQTLTLNGGQLQTGILALNNTTGAGTGIVNLNNGATLTATLISRYDDGAGQQFNWNDGTIQNNSSGGLILRKESASTANLVISLAGTGSHIFNAQNGKLITQQSEVNLVNKAGENGTLTKTGNGILYLSANNQYTGATTIQAGVLQVDNIGNGGLLGGLSGIGHASNAAANLVFDGGTLKYIGSATGSSGTTDRNFTVTANGGGIDASGTAAGVVVIQGSATLTGTNAARTFTFGGSSTLANTFSGTMGDNGTGATSINKTGVGQWIFTGNNTYTGDTTISAGTLVLAAGSQTVFDIGSDGLNNALVGGGDVGLNGNFSFDLTGAGTGLHDQWIIVDSALNENYGGTFSVLNFTPIDATLWERVNGGTTYQFDEATGILAVTAIPEPSTWALLAGSLTVVMVMRRRNGRA